MVRAQVAQAQRVYPAPVARLRVSVVLQLAAAARAWRAPAGCPVAQVAPWLGVVVLRLGWARAVAAWPVEARRGAVVAREVGAASRVPRAGLDRFYLRTARRA